MTAASAAMRVVQPRRLARRLAVDQPIRAVRVELDHPIPHDLQRHAADPGGLAAACAMVDRRQRQQSPRLRPVLAPARRSSHLRRREISPERDRQGKPPAFATLNQNLTASGKPYESLSQRVGTTRADETGSATQRMFDNSNTPSAA